MITRLASLLHKVGTLGPEPSWPGPPGGALGVVEALASGFDRVRREELDRRMAREALSPDEAERLERFSRSLVERLLQTPGQRLPRLAAAGLDPAELADALRLLGLADERPPVERSA